MKNEKSIWRRLVTGITTAAAAVAFSGCAHEHAGPPPSAAAPHDWINFQWLRGARQSRGEAICGTDAAIFVPHPNRYYYCAFTVSGRWLEVDGYGITVTHPAAFEAGGVLTRTLDPGGSIVVRNGKFTVDGSYQRTY